MSKVINEYNTIVNMLEAVKLDLLKGVSGNKSAAVRARHVLREARNKTHDLINTSLQDSACYQSGYNRHHFGGRVMTCFVSE
jgi:hypothetical protein